MLVSAHHETVPALCVWPPLMGTASITISTLTACYIMMQLQDTGWLIPRRHTFFLSHLQEQQSKATCEYLAISEQHLSEVSRV